MSDRSCPNCGEIHGTFVLGMRRDDSMLPVCPVCGYQTSPVDDGPDAFDTLVSELDGYPRHTLTTEEVYRRLPALNLIEDDSIREETAALSARAPAYFWVVRASKRYHNPATRGTHGLWAHTCMVAQAVEDLIWPYESRDQIDDVEADYARSAALLHDQRKLGPHTAPSESATSDHDLAMAEVIREESTLPDAVADAVESHMGASYDGPVPDPTGLPDLVHLADYWASRPNWIADLPSPVPAELRELGFDAIEE